MRRLLVRKSTNGRFFTGIDSALYRAEAGAGAGQKLLALSSTMSLTWWQRHAALRLGPDEQLGRLMVLHRLAFEAELDGQPTRADFFWREALACLERIWTRDEVWRAGLRIVGNDAVATPQALRDLVAAELFVDTHIAFANGRLADASRLTAGDRLFAHLGFIRRLLKLYTLPADEAARLLAPAVDAEIGSLESDSKWDVAISRLREYITLSPGDLPLQERLAGLYFRAAIARLTPGEGKGKANAASLSASIEPLERLRRDCPACSAVYDFLGHLYHIQSIQLGNGQQLAAALVAARKAQILSPGLEGGESTLSELAAAMTKLQKEMGEIESRLRGGGVTLSAEGQVLQREVKTGFTLLELYDRSPEPSQLAKDRRLAQARKLWRDVGLAAGDASDDKAGALLDVVGELYASEARTVDDLAEAFRKASTEKPMISNVAPEPVARFIVARRQENAGEDAAVAADQPEPASAFSISVPAAAARRDREPLWYWLLGRQDQPARILAAVAGVAAIAVAGLTILDAHAMRIRSDAYQAMTAAVRARDEKAIIAEAQRFLGAWTLRAEEPRDTAVRAAERDAVEAPHARIRNEAAAALQGAIDRDDGAAALAAAERFLAAPPLKGVDPRQQAVLDVYAREFVAWFNGLGAASGDTVQARVEKYKQLTSASLPGVRKP